MYFQKSRGFSTILLCCPARFPSTKPKTFLAPFSLEGHIRLHVGRGSEPTPAPSQDFPHSLAPGGFQNRVIGLAGSPTGSLSESMHWAYWDLLTTGEYDYLYGYTNLTDGLIHI